MNHRSLIGTPYFNQIFSISWYASISTSDTVYIIGGLVRIRDDYVKTSTIARYKNGKWKHVNDLAMARNSANAIQYGDKVMVIGGRSNRPGYDDP